MSLIEGFGDEVPLVFFLSAVLIGFLYLAWKSTEVSEPTIPEQGVHSDSNPSIPESIPESMLESNLLDSNSPHSSDEDPGFNSSNQASTLHSSSLTQSVEVPNNDQIPETQTQADHLAKEDGTSLRERKKTTTTNLTEGQSFTIKLMFMDDTHKTVEAHSQETLKDFKMKHFQVELMANKVVKLIFNGQVLRDEASQLSQLGLDNNCIVHCLIHQPHSSVHGSDTTGNVSNPRTLPNTPFQDDGNTASRSPTTTQETGIDIGGLLVPLLGIILALVWYCQIAYATHFSTAATIALVGLSSLCIFSFFVFSYPIAQEGLF